MNASDLVTLASNAGFTGSDVNVAAAIALAESSGIPTKYNPETQAGTPAGQGSYGLWQIYLRDHPEFAGSNLYDPQTNANAAYAVFQRQGFRAWSTYKYGQYLNYLSSVAASAGPVTIDASTGQAIPSTVDTDSLAPISAGVLGTGLTKSQILWLTALGAGVYIVADLLAD